MVLTTIVLASVVAVVGALIMVISPILPDVAAAFSIPEAQAAYGMTVYAGTTASSAFFLARLIDAWGTRLMANLGLLCLIVGLLLCGFAPLFPVLLLGQGVTGVASGVLLPCIYGLAASLAPPHLRATVTGRVLFGWSIAMVLGVPFSALISDSFGWRAAFWALAGLGALCLVALQLLPRPAQRTPRKRPARLSFEALTWPPVARVLLVCFFFMMAFYTCYTFVGAHVRATLGVDAAGAAWFVLAYGLGFGIAAFMDPWVDRLGPARLMGPILLVIACVYLVMPWGFMRLETGLLTAGVWGFFNHFVLTMIVMLLTHARPERSGEILGFYSTTTYIGTLVGTASMAPVFARFGYSALAYCAALVIFCAAAIWWFRRPVAESSES